MAGSFLKIVNIKGRSKQRVDHIDVQHWSISAHLPVDLDTSKAALTKGQSHMTDLHVVIPCDMTVVRLLQACVTAQHFNESHLFVTKDVNIGKGEPTAKIYFWITMKDLVISSVSLASAANQDPQLNVTLKFREIQTKYVEIDEKGSTTGQDGDGFDFAKHVPTAAATIAS